MKRLELKKIERISEVTHLINGSARIKKTERKTELIPGFLQESRSVLCYCTWKTNMCLGVHLIDTVYGQFFSSIVLNFIAGFQGNI